MSRWSLAEFQAELPSLEEPTEGWGGGLFLGLRNEDGFRCTLVAAPGAPVPLRKPGEYPIDWWCNPPPGMPISAAPAFHRMVVRGLTEASEGKDRRVERLTRTVLAFGEFVRNAGASEVTELEGVVLHRTSTGDHREIVFTRKPIEPGAPLWREAARAKPCGQEGSYRLYAVP